MLKGFLLQNPIFNMGHPIFPGGIYYLCANLREPMVYLTRVEHFNAAHKLYNPAWTAAQNEAVFGKCANENWHGHNYELLVTVKGKPDPDTGFVFDVKVLSKLIKEHVLDKLDHKNLNLDVPFLQGQHCSTENLAIAIWQQLQPHLPPQVQLHGIKLYETPRIFVEYFGE
jgi:6-pyruvoyltetrahydropterin/6-carboxytetrahydropterin synthase